MPSASRQVSDGLGVMLMVMAIIPTYIGIVGFLAETGEARWLMAVVVLGGAMMIAGGVQTIRRHRRDVRRERRHRARILAAVGRPAPKEVAEEEDADEPGDPGPVLAHWVYDGQQWTRHVETQPRGGCAEGCGLGIAIVLLGGYLGGGGPWAVRGAMALAVVAMVAYGVLVGRTTYLYSESGPPEAIITPTGLILNGEYHVLTGGQFRLLSIRHVAGMLTFHVGGRGAGALGETVNVPVPPGREAEAESLVKAFQDSLYRGGPVRVPRRR